MVSTIMSPMVACDSSFMIRQLFTFRIPGIDYDFAINTTHVAMFLVSVFIIIVAVIARVKINKARSEEHTSELQSQR